MGASAAKFLAEKYADAKIALFYNSGDTYGSSLDAFAEQAKASKLDIVDTETFKDDSSTSFANQLTKAMRKIKIEGLTGELTGTTRAKSRSPLRPMWFRTASTSPPRCAQNATGEAVLIRVGTLVTERKQYFHTIKWLNCINRQKYA